MPNDDEGIERNGDPLEASNVIGQRLGMVYVALKSVFLCKDLILKIYESIYCGLCIPSFAL